MARIVILLTILIPLLLLFACGKKEVGEDYYTEDEMPAQSSNEYSESEQSDTLNSEHKDRPASSPGSTIANYDYTWTGSDAIPDVVIIIDDFGYAAGSLLEDFASLPKEIVFAVLPDLPQTARSGQIASQNGHEVIIHVPMQALNSPTSPGARYIKTGMQAEEIRELLSDFHRQIPMAIAANNHMGSSATSDEDLMNPVLDHLNSLGLFFIDSAVTANRLSYNLAKQKGFRSHRRDIFLDVPDNTDATIAQKIEGLGRYKGRREPIVVITHCHNRSKLEALQKFITQIQAMGVRIISLREAAQYAAL